jgi:hypothetical protein
LMGPPISLECPNPMSSIRTTTLGALGGAVGSRRAGLHFYLVGRLQVLACFEEFVEARADARFC